MIIPSIDLMGGKAVQLVQGEKKVLEREDVLDLARDLSMYGDLAVIDLDAAKGTGDNLGLIRQICKVADCRVGGGIRTLEKAESILASGAKKMIIGTMADEGFLSRLPRDRIIVACDFRSGVVVDQGWRRSTGEKVQDRLRRLEPFCSGFLVTNVDIEGTLKGVDMDAISRLNSMNKLTIAGGISTVEDVRAIEDRGMDSQIGMALYTGKLDPTKLFISLLKPGLIPTIVQDTRGQVLMLAYSSGPSLAETFRTRQATYFSRSRNRLWKKGETSGNTQELLKVRYDCDRDSLLFIVKQKGAACHTGRYSCFGDKDFLLGDLYEVIKDRVANPAEGSYTSRLAADESLIMEKIREESDEVVDYKDRDNLVWELADLTYFMQVLMAKKGITIDDVRNELWRRRR